MEIVIALLIITVVATLFSVRYAEAPEMVEHRATWAEMHPTGRHSNMGTTDQLI